MGPRGQAAPCIRERQHGEGNSVSLEGNRGNASYRIVLQVRHAPFKQRSGPKIMALGYASANFFNVTLREAEAKLVTAQRRDGADEKIMPADEFYRLFPRSALRSPGPHW